MNAEFQQRGRKYKKESEVKNSVNKKYTNGNSRLVKAEERISDLDDRVMGSTQTEQQKEKK